MVASSSLCQCESSTELEDADRRSASLQRMEVAVRSLLEELGEDTTRDGLIDTPRRVAKAWWDMAKGGLRDCARAFGQARFTESVLTASPDTMVLVRDITFASLSEATLLPFHGRCHVAYIPKHGVVLGLSKLARATRCLASRLQRQERLTEDLLAAVHTHVDAKGVAVVVQASHLGLGSTALTSQLTVAMCGCFEDLETGQLEEMFALLGLGAVPTRTKSEGATATVVTLSAGSRVLEPGSFCSRNVAADEASIAALPPSPKLIAAIEALLEGLGENPRRLELVDSVRYYASWVAASTSGLRMQAPALVAIGPVTPGEQSVDESSDTCSDDMSTELADGACCFNLRSRGQELLAMQAAALQGQLWDIQVFITEFVSQCEHHLLPFYGTLKLAYSLPSDGGADGAARIPPAALDHVVRMFSRRLQVQERLTQQVADGVLALAGSANVLVVCESSHMCMVARGVEEHASTTLTTAARGGWALSAATRKSTLNLLLHVPVVSSS